MTSRQLALRSSMDADCKPVEERLRQSPSPRMKASATNPDLAGMAPDLSDDEEGTVKYPTSVSP